MPFVISSLLERYGYPTTLRAISIGLAALTGPLLPLLKGRVQPSSGASTARRTDWSCVRTPLFWVYCTSNVLQGFGYFFSVTLPPLLRHFNWTELQTRRATPGAPEYHPSPRSIQLRLSLRPPSAFGPPDHDIHLGVRRCVFSAMGPSTLTYRSHPLRPDLRILRRGIRGHMGENGERRFGRANCCTGDL